MQELIWYAIPGGVILSAVLMIFPDLLKGNEAVIIVGAPVTGFVVHQFVRLVFEVLGGWHCRWRPIVKAIQRKYGLPDSKKARYDAWLVWEITFYSNDVHESFRDRDRRAWHYVLSFWSVAFAGFVSIILLLTALWFGHPPLYFLGLTIASLSILVLFVAKAFQTLIDVCKLEVSFFCRNEEGFDKNAIVILNKLNQKTTNKAPEASVVSTTQDQR